MQDLNDKITGSQLTAAEWDEVPSELQNVIEALGIALLAEDLNQLGKAIAGYAAASDFYSETGVVDAYVCTKIGAKQGPPAYEPGLRVRFRPGNANTGASTINVNGVGIRDLVREDGSALSAGDLVTARDAVARYDQATDDFFLADHVRTETSETSDLLVARLSRVSDTTVKFSPVVGSGIKIEVDGAILSQSGDLSFDITSVLESGQSESASTPFYLYVHDSSGSLAPHISKTPPVFSGGKVGYHPGTGTGSTTWKCVGSFWNDASSHVAEFFTSAGWHLFSENGSDQLHTLGTSTPTAWTAQNLNVPQGATAVKLASLIRSSAAQAVYGLGNATATLPSDAGPKYYDDGGMGDVFVATGPGANANEGTSLEFTLPIDDVADPEVRWGIVGTGSVTKHILKINGYFDPYAPRY